MYTWILEILLDFYFMTMNDLGMQGIGIKRHCFYLDFI